MDIKSNTTSIAGAGKAGITPDQKAEQKLEIQENIEQLNAHINKLENYKASSEYLSMADNDKIVQLQERAKMQVELLESLLFSLETGAAFDPANAQQVDHTEMVDYIETQLGTGFHDDNGELILFDESDMVDADGKPLINVPSYAGTIMLENSGTYDPLNPTSTNALFYVLDEDVVAVTARTEGTHIYMEEELVDGSIRVIKLADMATRNEPIYVHAGNANQGVRIDLSQAARMADGNWGEAFGKQKGFFIGGSKHDDVIIGSSGNDIIWGDLGDDKIYGLGGRDEIYGDGYNQISAGGFTDMDGNDQIDGGAGQDIIRAGGGNQDIVFNGNGDMVSEDEKKGLANQYVETNIADLEWLNQSPAWEGHKAPDGTIVINAKPGESGPLQLWMDDQFSMMSANVDGSGNGLVVTMAGFDEEGDAVEMRIRINDFFNSDVQLEVKGNDANNIIDFSAITLHGQHVVMSGGDGNDIMFAPKSEFDSLGIPTEDLGHGTVPNSELESILHQGMTVFDDNGNTHPWMTWGLEGSLDDMAAGVTTFWDGFDGEVSEFIENGEIVLKPLAEMPESLNFTTPAGYERAYFTTDPEIIGDGAPMIIFVKRNVDGSIEQAIVRLEGLDAETMVKIDGVPATHIDHLPSTVSGGAGTDTVFGSASSMHTTDSVQHAVTGTYDYDFEYEVAENIALQTKIDDLDIQIQEINTDLGAAEQKQQDALSSIETKLRNILTKNVEDGHIDPDTNQITEDFKEHAYNKAQDLFALAKDNLGASEKDFWVSELKSYLASYVSDDTPDHVYESLASEMVALVGAMNDVILYNTQLHTAEYTLDILEKKKQGSASNEE